MKKLFLTFLAIFLFILSYSQVSKKEKTDSITSFLESYLNSEGERPVNSILVYYEDPDFKYYDAVGMADGKSQPVEKDYQFKIASTTKTFTATVILLMAEEDLVDLDAPMHKYLSGCDFVRIDDIHIIDGKSYGKEVTVRQLLQHRSGIADMFFDKFEAFMEHWNNNRMKQWNTEKLFEYFYAQEINKLTHFPPGEGFHYSDVNYFLLGLIIEQVSGETLPQQIRLRILEPLRLKNTWFEYYEDPEGHQEVAHSFQGPEDITLESNTSFDWAGGGLISTTKDLAIFIQVLMNGSLFKDPETLKQMMDICETAWGFEYGLGLIAFTINDTKYYGHSGFWGVVMIYQPELKQTLCLCFNQAAAPFNYIKFSADIIQIANMK
jgi:D-alanyl-D-alanine carboxypeptidase